MSKTMWLAIVAAGCALSGCSQTLKVQGRVVEGPTGIATTVRQTDSRLVETGIPNVEVVLLTPDGEELGTAMTDEEGVFELPIAQSHTGKMMVRVRDDRYPDVRSNVDVPDPEERLLVLVKERRE